MEGVGFEPTKAEPPDLQSGPFGRSGTPPRRKQCIFFDRQNRVKLNVSRIGEADKVDDSTQHVVRATSEPWRDANVRRVVAREAHRDVDESPASGGREPVPGTKKPFDETRFSTFRHRLPVVLPSYQRRQRHQN